jgi:LPS export ABC transporter protein LptC
MNWGKVSLVSSSAVWATAIVLWPLGSNLVTNRFDARQLAYGQSLYKSSLTSAGFGMLGAQFYESNDNARRWNIRSQFAELHRKENYAFMQDVDAEFYAGHTGNTVFTKSDYGRSYLDKNLVDLDGKVSIRSKRGYLFTMEHLTYHGDKHFFDTKDLVLMKGPEPESPTMQLRGTGLWADIDREHFLLKHRVTALRRLKTNEWMHTTSNTGEFFTDEQHAIFRGNAHTLMPAIVLDSDELELEIHDDTESILAKGNVVLKNKDRLGHAERAAIVAGSNRIELEGKARIDSKGNIITGERIILYTDDDRIDVDEARGKVQP